MESNRKIFDKIEEMYNLKDDEGKQKNKAFFSHLIRAYLPLKSVSVAEKKPESRKTKVRCVFTKKPLITVEEAMEEATTDSFKNNIQDFLLSFDKEKGCFISTTPMKQLFKGKILAIQGTNTKTYMSQESYSTFINWVMTRYLSGDGHIKWLLHQLSKNNFHPGISVSSKKRKNKKPRIYSTKGKKKSTLGDLSDFQDLKDKFKDQE